MKKHLVLSTLISIFQLISFSQNPVYQWAYGIGGTSYDETRGLETDLNGNIYVVGQFDGTVDFDPGAGTTTVSCPSGQNMMFITKSDPNGNLIWVRTFGASNYLNAANSIEVDNNGNVFIVGSCGAGTDFDPSPSTYTLGATGIFVLKLDATGNLVWVKGMGGTTGTKAYDVELDIAGNVYLVGNFSNTVDFDPGVGTHTVSAAGSPYVFILKLDPSGDFVWLDTFGNGSGSPYASSISVEPSGNIVIGGRFSGTIDFDPSASTAYTLSALSGQSIFILKLNSSGSLVWANGLGDDTGYNGGGCRVNIDNIGDIYVTGDFTGTVDFISGVGNYTMNPNGGSDMFLLKINSAGNFKWVKNVGGVYNDVCYSSCIDGSGGIYIVGSFKGTVDFDPGPSTLTLTSVASLTANLFTTKFDTSGNFKWVKSLNGNNFNYLGVDIKVASSGDVYTTGTFTGTLDFDPETSFSNITSNGDVDGFLQKMNQSVTGKEDFVNDSSFIHMYPNPSDQYVCINTRVDGEIHILDLSGRVVKEQKIFIGRNEIWMNELPVGIYFFETKINGYTYVDKILKE